MTRNFWLTALVFVVLAFIVFLIYNTKIEPSLFPEIETQTDRTRTANPASEYCTLHDGTIDIRDQEDGQVGYCVFPDGSECEEWSYYRNECPTKINE